MAVRSSNTEKDQAVFLVDNCDTAYIPNQGHGDLGMNIAEHPESQLAGFQDIEDFSNQVESVAEEIHHPSSALVYLLAEESETEQLEGLLDVACSAQHPGDYGDGFLHLVDYRQGEQTNVVTAGLEDAARYALKESESHHNPNVVGGRLKQNGHGIEVDAYCAGNEKLNRIEQDLGVDFDDKHTVAFGNSGNDGPMMVASDEAFGWDRTREYSTGYFEDDPEFWSRGAAAVLADQLMQDQPLDKARETAFDYLETGQNRYGTVELNEIEEGEREGPVTEQVTGLYSDLRPVYTEAVQ